jgi:hypothetical protein
MIAASHELAHSFMHRIRNKKNQNTHLQIYQWYEQLNFISERTYFGKNYIGQVIDIFKESTYSSNPSNKDGHPSDNHDEMFASIVTVMRYHAKELVDRINSLRPGTSARKEGESDKQYLQRTDLEKAEGDLSISDARLLVKRIIDILLDEIETAEIMKGGEGDIKSTAIRSLSKIFPELSYLESSLGLSTAQEDNSRLMDEWAKLYDVVYPFKR